MGLLGEGDNAAKETGSSNPLTPTLEMLMVTPKTCLDPAILVGLMGFLINGVFGLLNLWIELCSAFLINHFKIPNDSILNKFTCKKLSSINIRNLTIDAINN